MGDTFDFTPPGRIARVRFTPMSDALHWHWSGRLDPRAAIADANLPAPIPGLIDWVVRRTRLWRGERLDVARELCAHFADGLASGRSAEDLVREFGPPRLAARLIRGAKLRNRSWPWQCWRRARRAALAMLAAAMLAYVGLAIRFYLGRPSIEHNYWREINAARRVPEAERAWPVYREALLKLGKLDAEWIDRVLGQNLVTAFAESPITRKNWKEAAALVERHQDVIELARVGAARPSLAFYLGDPGDLAATKDKDADWLISRNMDLADENRNLISALLHGPQHTTTLAGLLVVDARVAAEANDPQRVASDLTGMLSMAEQLFEPDATLVEQLLGMVLFSFALDTSGWVLAEHADVFSDVQWTALSHQFAAFRGGRIKIDFTGDRMLFADVMQRAYTDNGHSDGRITPAGLALMDSHADFSMGLLKAADPTAASSSLVAISGRVLSPGVAAMVGTREENQQLYDSMLDETIAAHQAPSWQWQRSVADEISERMGDPEYSVSNRLRYMFTWLLLPGIQGVFHATARTEQQRDAAEVAIALELWHRRNQNWPEKLEQLVPDLLPGVPPDRVDGQPLRYAVRDNRPVLYSIGPDHEDNGGMFSARHASAIAYGRGRQEQLRAINPGDWILWPPPRDPDGDELGVIPGLAPRRFDHPAGGNY